jgi:surfactin family lipopeptide synthetase C
VVVACDTAGERRLVAYVVPKAGQAPAPGMLRDFLRERLPEYMVAAAIMSLDSLPVTPNGKVDRRALPAPNWHNTNGHYAAPATPVEDVLSKMWANLLGLKRVCVNDSFFDLGGHSLLATQLMSRVRETFRTELPLRSLFESPTVAGLARVLAVHEAKPGLADKIARVVQRLEGMSQEDLRAATQKKRDEKGTV